jgi:hypothetical protein
MLWVCKNSKQDYNFYALRKINIKAIKKILELVYYTEIGNPTSVYTTFLSN